jgi:hypothetical protein
VIATVKELAATPAMLAPSANGAERVGAGAPPAAFVKVKVSAPWASLIAIEIVPPAFHAPGQFS